MTSNRLGSGKSSTRIDEYSPWRGSAIRRRRHVRDGAPAPTVSRGCFTTPSSSSPTSTCTPLATTRTPFATTRTPLATTRTPFAATRTPLATACSPALHAIVSPALATVFLTPPGTHSQ